MFKSRDMIEILERAGIFNDMFDVVRLVDPEKGVLLESEPNGNITASNVCCTEFLGRDGQCRNCTSLRAYYSNETVVKVEYANGIVALVISKPAEISDHKLVVELIKDITKSMTFRVEEGSDPEGIAQMIGNLNLLAVTDGLTGLFNRRYLDDKLRSVLKACEDLSENLYVAMLDLDNFKQINDQYGHQAGDAVLRIAADVVSSYARRGSDWAARYGGEEFFMCFPGASDDVIEGIMESMLQELEKTPVPIGEDWISMTASIGLTKRMPGDTPETLMARTDQLLYKAKNGGKNRCEKSF